MNSVGKYIMALSPKIESCQLCFRFEESAMMYAQTQNSFEEIALRFIKLDKKDALKSFIHKKLQSLKPQVQNV